MSKRRDPVIPVLTYFETAELPLATQTLAIVQAILKRRTPRAASTKPRAVHTRAKAVPPEPAAVTN